MMKRSRIIGNNRGFSLVEVLIGVAILAFVIGPLLYSFIVSHRTTAKSHFVGDATLSSRNIVETVKFHGVRNVLADIAADTSPFGGSSEIDTSYLGVWDADLGVYQFRVNDIEGGTLSAVGPAGGATTLFDAIVTIDSTPYKVADETDPAYPGLNDMVIADYTPLDVIYVQLRNPLYDPDAMAVEEFSDRLLLLDPSLNPAAIFGGVQKPYNRVIFLNVIYDPGDETITLEVVYRYTYTHPGYPPFTPFEVSTEIHKESYDITATDHDPLTVYLFYRPHYTVAGADPDLLVIDNVIGLDLSVYAVKQPPLFYDPTDPTYIAIFESTYRARILQLEAYSLMADGKFMTNVNTNFNYDYSNGTEANVEMPRFAQTIRYGAVMQVAYPYPAQSLVTQNKQDRLFDITVEIYRSGEIDTGGTPLAVYEASQLD